MSHITQVRWNVKVIDSAPALRAHRTLRQRLRPFLRRELKSRLLSAAAAFGLIVGLSWLAVAALTGMDTESAHALRVELGMEAPDAVCGGYAQPSCSYDDQKQRDVERQYELDRRIRGAVLADLELRIHARQASLKEAKKLLETTSLDFEDRAYGGSLVLKDLLSEQVGMQPLTTLEHELDRHTELLDAAVFDERWDVDGDATQARLVRAIDARLVELSDYQAEVDAQQAREAQPWEEVAHEDRELTWGETFDEITADDNELALWLAQAGGAETTTSTLAALLEYERPRLAAALDPEDPVWQYGFSDPVLASTPIDRPSVRYRSPVETSVFLRLFGTTLLVFAAGLLLVVGPVVTATTTAREREAGTLPVLRMTGLSAGDLALAMAVGPNVFALVAGFALLGLAAGFVGLAGAGGLLLTPIALLLLLTLTTHAVAIGLGDALGQRVNAMVVGGALAVAVVLPGLLGSVLAAFNVTGSGLLLGPLPAVFGSLAAIPALPDLGMNLESQPLGAMMLVYALLVQVLLGMVCLHTWRRRVEQSWAPLFRPVEGIVLSVASVGCSALTLLDLSARVGTQDFDQLNLLTFMSSAFLLPVVAWLIVVSLRRPARANGQPSHIEARRAFVRFQLLLGATGVAVGLAYSLVMANSHLSTQQTEVMWATLTQGVLAAETALGALLWASRRRTGRAKVVLAGSALVMVQAAFTFGVYWLEVAHVARYNAPALPFMVGMDVSPYWVALMILLWAAGIAMIAAALMASRTRPSAETQAAGDAPAVDEDEEDDGEPRGRRLLH